MMRVVLIVALSLCIAHADLDISYKPLQCRACLADNTESGYPFHWCARISLYGAPTSDSNGACEPHNVRCAGQRTSIVAQQDCPNDAPSGKLSCSLCTLDAYTWCQDESHGLIETMGSCHQLDGALNAPTPVDAPTLAPAPTPAPSTIHPTIHPRPVTSVPISNGGRHLLQSLSSAAAASSSSSSSSIADALVGSSSGVPAPAPAPAPVPGPAPTRACRPSTFAIRNPLNCPRTDNANSGATYASPVGPQPTMVYSSDSSLPGSLFLSLMFPCFVIFCILRALRVWSTRPRPAPSTATGAGAGAASASSSSSSSPSAPAVAMVSAIPLSGPQHQAPLHPHAQPQPEARLYPVVEATPMSRRYTDDDEAHAADQLLRAPAGDAAFAAALVAEEEARALHDAASPSAAAAVPPTTTHFTTELVNADGYAPQPPVQFQAPHHYHSSGYSRVAGSEL